MLCPEEALGFEQSGIYVQTSRIGGSYPRHILVVEQGSYGEKAFKCCGAGCMSSIRGTFVNIKEVQSFLAFFVRHYSLNVSYYYIITDPNLYKADLLHISGLLQELGAEVIDSRPNRVHGPSKLYMMVWEPALHLDKLDKYVKRYPVAKPLGYTYPEWEADPLWFFENKEKENVPVPEVSQRAKVIWPTNEQGLVVNDGQWPGWVQQYALDQAVQPFGQLAQQAIYPLEGFKLPGDIKNV